MSTTSLVPDNLDGWTLAVVEALVRLGYFESRLFDFKEMLPAPTDVRGKDRLRKSIAGFATSTGGFFIYGVRDAKSLSAADRIVGVDHATDVPAQFGSHATHITPRAEWMFKNQPIELPTGRVLHVVHVFEGRMKPYGIWDGQEKRWTFVKRTDAGNEALSYEELRDAFRNQLAYERQLARLRAETERMKQHAHFLISGIGAGFYDQYLRRKFQPHMFESLFMQVLPDLDPGDLVDAGSQLRVVAYAADDEAEHVLEGDHPEELASLARAVFDYATRVLAGLARISEQRAVR